MKKITAGIAAAAMVAALGGATVFAAGHGYGAGNNSSAADTSRQSTVCEYCEQYGNHYTDENGDGICDHYQDKVSAGTTQDQTWSGIHHQEGIHDGYCGGAQGGHHGEGGHHRW